MSKRVPSKKNPKSVKKVSSSKSKQKLTEMNVLENWGDHYSKGRDTVMKMISKLKSDYRKAMEDSKDAREKYLKQAKEWKAKSSTMTKKQWENAKHAYELTANATLRLKKQLMLEVEKHKLLDKAHQKYHAFRDALIAFEKEWSKKNSELKNQPTKMSKNSKVKKINR